MSTSCADKPCPTCPWRKSSTTGGSDIPNFSIELMRNLADTVPPQGSDVPWPRKVFACHNSKQGGEYACAGYVARHGETNVNLMLLGIDVERIKANCAGIDLYEDFHQMLAAYEVALGNQAAEMPQRPARLRLVLDECIPGENRWQLLEEHTGIRAGAWEQTYLQGLEPTEEMTKAIMRLWPGHGVWVASGLTHMQYIQSLKDAASAKLSV